MCAALYSYHCPAVLRIFIEHVQGPLSILHALQESVADVVGPVSATRRLFQEPGPDQPGPTGPQDLPPLPKPKPAPAGTISTRAVRLTTNPDGSSKLSVGRFFPFVTVNHGAGGPGQGDLDVSVGPAGGVFSQRTTADGTDVKVGGKDVATARSP